MDSAAWESTKSTLVFSVKDPHLMFNYTQQCNFGYPDLSGSKLFGWIFYSDSKNVHFSKPAVTKVLARNKNKLVFLSTCFECILSLKNNTSYGLF